MPEEKTDEQKKEELFEAAKKAVNPAGFIVVSHELFAAVAQYLENQPWKNVAGLNQALQGQMTLEKFMAAHELKTPEKEG